MADSDNNNLNGVPGRNTKAAEKARVSKAKSKGQGTKPMGRPTDFTQDLANEICARLSEGQSLRRVCEDEDMPGRRTVFQWLNSNDDFAHQYARAKEEAADSLADDIEDIADGTLKGKYDPQAARVAMDGKKWIASKLKPKRYGDRLDLTGEQTINHKFRNLDDDQLDKAIETAKNSVS